MQCSTKNLQINETLCKISPLKTYLGTQKMKNFGNMNMDEIRFVEDLTPEESLFASKALSFYTWPKNIEINSKIYEFVNVENIKPYMVGTYESAAKYKIINHDTNPISEYDKNDEFNAIARARFSLKTLDVKENEKPYLECNILDIKRSLNDSFDLGFFVAIIKNHLLFAYEREDKQTELFYLDKNDNKQLLKKYESMKSLIRDAKKFDFNFGH